MTDSCPVLAHERLSIVGVDSGAQPLTNKNESIALAVNGEIYNHRVIRKTLKEPYHFKTHSDCEVIIPLVCISLRMAYRVSTYPRTVYGIRH